MNKYVTLLAQFIDDAPDKYKPKHIGLTLIKFLKWLDNRGLLKDEEN